VSPHYHDHGQPKNDERIIPVSPTLLQVLLDQYATASRARPLYRAAPRPAAGVALRLSQLLAPRVPPALERP